MTDILRDKAVAVGSISVVLVVILLISADAETAAALGIFCVVGYVSHYAYRRSSAMRAIRSHVTSRRKRGVGLVVALGAIVLVADTVDEGLWVAGMILFGYTGYRSGRVFRGAFYGMVVAVVSSVVLVVLLGGTLLFVSVFDVGGARSLLVKVLFAPHVVGFFTLLWVVFVLALGAITGLVSGAFGGALAQLRT